MGSRSTYVRGGFGGLQGRALRKGDLLRVREGALRTGTQRSKSAALGRVRADDERARRADRGAGAGDRGGQVVRIIAGQKWGLFTPAAHRCC